MQKEDKKVRKKKSGAWTIGWGWLITVPVLAFVSWATKRGIHDAFDEEHPSPVNILKERYVKGDIDKNEYEQKLRDILST